MTSYIALDEHKMPSPAGDKGVCSRECRELALQPFMEPNRQLTIVQIVDPGFTEIVLV